MTHDSLPFTRHSPVFQRRWVIFVLGLLSALSPFSTDLYLPAFPQIAQSLQTTTGSLSLTLSSYFLGVAFGQMFYGPLLDRFGRKKPLYIGLGLYVLASLACIFTRTLYGLIAWRFITAVGGCVTSVVAVAIVRDLFTMRESSKIFSQLTLVVGVSPLLAPIIGSTVAIVIGWQAVFLILIIIACGMIVASVTVLPETHLPDKTVLLSPAPILRSYWEVSQNPQFYTYAFAGGVSFAGLFVYIAASPILFFNFFKLSPYYYGLVFTLLAAGFIGASQVNILLLRRFHSIQIFKIAISAQIMCTLLLLMVAWLNWYPLSIIIVLLFGMLACIGIAYPNATVLAMAPFAHKAGRASALMSLSQSFIGALASISVGLFSIGSMRPIALVLAASASGAGLLFIFGKRNIITLHEGEENNESAATIH
ncbi:MAG: multidrug effflux MFS transporter [Chthoniobacterales bacterium]